MLTGIGISLTSSAIVSEFLPTHNTRAECQQSSNSGSSRSGSSVLEQFDFAKVGMAAGVGAVPGFCAGFMLRKLGNVAIFFVGSTFCVFQLAAYKGYVTIHWEKVEKDLKSVMDTKAAGDVLDPSRAEERMNEVVTILTPHTTNGAMGGFGIGFFAGMKLG